MDNPVYINCDICGNDDYEVLLQMCPTISGPLVRCRQCELIYVNPRDAQFAVDVQTADFSARRIAVWEEYKQLWGQTLISPEIEAKHFQKNFEVRINIVKRFIPEGKLLDVGCGLGDFLKVAQDKGYDVTGIEPNALTATKARNEYGLNVINGVLPQPILRENQFDVISILHVMEHLPSPRDELGKIYPLLKQGGYIFVEVPNIDTIWYRILKEHWRQFIPDHYFFFTPKTLSKLLEQQGFHVLEISRIGKKMSIRFFLSRLWRYEKKISPHLIKLAEKVGLSDKSIYVKTGDVIYAVAQKV